MTNYPASRPHRFGIVYLVSSPEVGRVYIGQTWKFHVSQRWREHLGSARRGSMSSKLYAAIREHGESAFKCEGIACAWRKGDLNELEQILIAQYDAERNGYNSDGPDSREKRRKFAAAVKRLGADFAIEILDKAAEQMKPAQ